MEHGRGAPSLVPTRWFDKRREFPGGTWGWAPARNAFWRILKATERSFLHLYPDVLSSSNSVSCHIGGACQDLGAIAPAPK